MTKARTVRTGLLIIAAASVATHPSLADTGRKSRHSVPARVNHAAPDVTATIAKPVPKPVAPPSPAPDDTTIPPPFALPVASRAKVRACGETWRDMKLAGTTGDDDWREFAMKCLVGKDPTALAN